MELLQLKYFAECARTENFSQVAKKYMVPQPSISKTIKKLETELGVNLFDRHGKQISLNANGHYFYEKVSIALENINQGIAHFQLPLNSNIVIYPQAGGRFVSLLIADFLLSNNNIFVSTVGNHPETKEPDFDFTFIQDSNYDINYTKLDLMEDEIIVIVPKVHPLSQYSKLDIKDLSNESFIGYYRSIGLRDFTDNYCQKYGGFTPKMIFETHDYSAIRYMLDKGKGISLMPKKFFELQHSEKVVLVPLKNKVYRTLSIAWHQDKVLSPSEKCFLEYSKKWFEAF